MSRVNEKNQVYISNIPKGWKWYDVKKMVDSVLGVPAYVDLFSSQAGEFGSGVIEFRNELQARMAIQQLHK